MRISDRPRRGCRAMPNPRTKTTNQQDGKTRQLDFFHLQLTRSPLSRPIRVGPAKTPIGATSCSPGAAPRSQPSLPPPHHMHVASSGSYALPFSSPTFSPWSSLSIIRRCRSRPWLPTNPSHEITRPHQQAPACVRFGLSTISERLISPNLGC